MARSRRQHGGAEQQRGAGGSSSSSAGMTEAAAVEPAVAAVLCDLLNGKIQATALEGLSSSSGAYCKVVVALPTK